jgi:hypothetical protein
VSLLYVFAYRLGDLLARMRRNWYLLLKPGRHKECDRLARQPSNSAHRPVSPSLFPGGTMVLALWRPADNARLYALGRFFFTITLIALALLHVALLALSRAIDVLRALCGLLFRLLITIRAARLLVHLVLIFHSYFFAPLNVALSSA